MFSDGFLEAQTRDITEGFPPNSFPYTDHYEYLSDSDLEDSFEEEEEDSAEHGEQELPRRPQDSDSDIPPAATSGGPPLPPRNVNEAEDDSVSAPNPAHLFNLSC